MSVLGLGPVWHMELGDGGVGGAARCRPEADAQGSSGWSWEQEYTLETEERQSLLLSGKASLYHAVVLWGIRTYEQEVQYLVDGMSKPRAEEQHGSSWLIMVKLEARRMEFVQE